LYLARLTALLRADLVTCVRAPRDLIIAMLLSAAFLVVVNQLLVVQLDSNLYVGVYSGDRSAVRTLARHFRNVGLTTVQYTNGAEAQATLERGALLACVVVTGHAPRSVEVLFSGQNPLLDRELAALMLSAASGLSQQTAQDSVMTIRGGRYSPDEISLFMAAGMLPFLVLLLAGAFCGLRWVGDAERGTLHTFFVTPTPRWVLLVARTCATGATALAVLLFAIAVCRPLLTWSLPGALLPWLGVLCLLTVASCGIYFAIASFSPTTVTFNAVAYIIGFVLLLVSGVLVPVETMPTWERVLAHCTPTFYGVRAMRDVMIAGRAVRFSDLLIVAAWGAGCYLTGYVHLLYRQLRAH
jgi:ABC-type multidrug transport system permease subunit